MSQEFQEKGLINHRSNILICILKMERCFFVVRVAVAIELLFSAFFYLNPLWTVFNLQMQDCQSSSHISFVMSSQSYHGSPAHQAVVRTKTKFFCDRQIFQVCSTKVRTINNKAGQQPKTITLVNVCQATAHVIIDFNTNSS